MAHKGIFCFTAHALFSSESEAGRDFSVFSALVSFVISWTNASFTSLTGISSVMDLLKSKVVFLKLRNNCPALAAISGNLSGPINITLNTRMSNSSRKPIPIKSTNCPLTPNRSNKHIWKRIKLPGGNHQQRGISRPESLALG